MFKQGNAIRDYVFPLATANRVKGEMHFNNLLGSGFVIGSNSWALTCSHVTQANNLANDEIIVTMFVADDRWCGFEVTNIENHPTEDVAIFKIQHEPLSSIFSLSDSWEGSSLNYKMFGYPDDMMFELDESGRSTGRPDLVYLQGYIRRRINHDIPQLRGKAFFELSEVGGTGCSGNPVFKIIPNDPVWKIVGIYCGEKLNDRGASVSYAVRAEVFRNWIPEVLGKPIIKESNA